MMTPNGTHFPSSSGWTGMIEVEAHVCTIRNAAGTDDAGLLNPLLKRWQDQACSQMVFGLPAVQSVINFKWDRYTTPQSVDPIPASV